MRWPWQRRTRDRDTPSLEAKRRAEDDLRKVREKWPQVRARAESLRDARRRNHFGEAMIELFRGQT